MRLAFALAPLFRTRTGTIPAGLPVAKRGPVFGGWRLTLLFAPSFGAMSDNSAESSGPSREQKQAQPLAVAEPDTPELTYETWALQTKTLVESLYDGISAPFCCGGTLRLRHPVQVTSVKDNVTYTIQPPPTRFPDKDVVNDDNDEEEDEGEDADADVDVDAAKAMVKEQENLLRDFVKTMPPAVFGKGSEEVYDASVRNGKQLLADAFTTNIEPEMLREVLRQIQSDLGLTVGIEAEPYSINVYEEGGLFESHKDTPRGQDMFGTLVLCLPSLFLGGALEVGMTLGATHSFFGKHLVSCKIPFQDNRSGAPSWWRTTIGKSIGGPVAVPWCAFFSDADHRVSPVRKGVRVALSYLLRRTDGASGADLAAPRALAESDAQPSALVEAFRSIKSNPFKPAVRVAVPCDHLYTTPEIWPYKEDENWWSEASVQNVNRLTPDTVGRLKGRDALVARAAAAAGLQVFLMPVLKSKNAEYAVPVDVENYFIPSFDTSRLGEMSVQYGPSIYDLYTPEAEVFYRKDVADLWIKELSAGAEKRKGAVAYLGNGPADIHEFYLRALLLFEPYPPCTFKFTLGELSQDVKINFANGQTLRDVIYEARRDVEGGLFSDPRLASALDSSKKEGDADDEAPRTLKFELKGAVDPAQRVVTYEQEDFLGMIPSKVAGLVPAGTDPVVISVSVAKRGLDEDSE